MLNDPLYIKSDEQSLIPAHCHFGKHMLDNLRKYSGSDKIALIQSETGKKLTYKELTQYAVDLSYGLYDKGVRRGDVVALGSERRNEFLPTLLAVIMAGATFTSVDYNGGLDIILPRLNQIKPKYFIFSELFWNKYGDAIKSLNSVETWITLDDGPDSAISVTRLMATGVDVQLFEPAPVDGQSDVAISFYSSGTTGTSKIISHTHVTLLQHTQKDGLMEDNFKVIYCDSEWYHSYDSIFALAVLRWGRTLVHHPYVTPDSLKYDLQNYKVNLIVSVPALLNVLSQVDEDDAFESLLAVLCAGSSLNGNILELLKKRNPKVQFLQGYGMSEADFITCETRKPGASKQGSIGKPVPNVTLKIVDPQTRRLLGPNQPGEMWLRSPGLMKGYLNVSDPILDAEGFFNTGDIGYYDDDHFFFYKNRAKDSLNYDSFEVAVVDIEGVLLRHAGVREACVVGAPDPVRGDLPTAFVVTEPGADVTEEELVTYVEDKVAHYMQLRGGVRFVDELPRNRLGKVLRRTLTEILKKEQK